MQNDNQDRLLLWCLFTSLLAHMYPNGRGRQEPALVREFSDRTLRDLAHSQARGDVVQVIPLDGESPPRWVERDDCSPLPPTSCFVYHNAGYCSWACCSLRMGPNTPLKRTIRDAENSPTLANNRRLCEYCNAPIPFDRARVARSTLENMPRIEPLPSGLSESVTPMKYNFERTYSKNRLAHRALGYVHSIADRNQPGRIGSVERERIFTSRPPEQ